MPVCHLIRVEQVELSEKEEMEQNLFMNNRSAQGEFDEELVKMMLEIADPKQAGYDQFEIDLMMLSEVDYDRQIEEQKIEKWSNEIIEQNEELKSISDQTKQAQEGGVDRSKDFYEDTPENQVARHNEIEKVKNRIKNTNSEDNDGGALSYVVLNFQNNKFKESFMVRMGFSPFDVYVDGDAFSEIIERIE